MPATHPGSPALGKRQARKPANSPKLTAERAIDFVLEVLRGSPELELIKSRTNHDQGRPRALRIEVLIAAAVAQAATEQSNIHVRGIAALLRSLPIGVQRVHGVRWTDPHGRGEQIISERQVEYLFGRLAEAFNTDGQRHDHPFELDGQVIDPFGEFLGPAEDLDPGLRHRLDCHEDCPLGVTMQQLGNRLLALLWRHTGLPDSGTYAIDSSVIPTHFATKSWGPLGNMDPQGVPDEAKDRVSADLGQLTDRGPSAGGRRVGAGAAKSSKGWKGSSRRTTKSTRALVAATLDTAGDEAPDRDPRSRKPAPSGPTVAGDFTRFSPEFPQAAQDGRLAHTKDTGARNAYRGAGNNRPSAIVNGRDNHALVDAGFFPDGTPNPGFVRAFHAVPGGADKVEAGLSLLGNAEANGVQPGTVSLDRIYTAADPEAFHHPIARAGWLMVKDLKQVQRAPRVWVPGVTFVDGFWFTAGMPDPLVALSAPPRNASNAARQESQQEFDKRSAYAFRIHAYTPKGGIRLRGPAVPDHVTGTRRNRKVIGVRVRCENSEYYSQLPRHIPKTTCVKGTPCACSTTFTVRADELPNSFEPLLWGSTKWAKEYGRRNLSETAFSIEQYDAGLDRHSIRVQAKKWDLAFTCVILSTWIRQFFSLVLRLGAAALDPAHWSPLQSEVFEPAIARLLEPRTSPKTTKPTARAG